MSIDPDLITGKLSSVAAWDVRVIRETVSTNSTLFDWGKRGVSGPLALFAESQTGGRGRRGRTWESQPGASMTASVLLSPEVPPGRWQLLTLATGVAIADALSCYAPVRLKWPNDLYLDDRKLGGILVETQVGSARGFAIVGFGINLRQCGFDPAIADRATSLEFHTGNAPDYHEVAARILDALAERIPESWNDPGKILQRFEDLDCLRNRIITARERSEADPIRGTAVGIDDSGRLVLRLPSGGFRALEDAWEIRPET